MIKNEDERDVWLTRWETPVPGTPEIVSDERGYVEWLEWLVSTGKIPPIPTYVLDRQHSQTERLMHEAGALVEGFVYVTETLFHT